MRPRAEAELAAMMARTTGASQQRAPWRPGGDAHDGCDTAEEELFNEDEPRHLGSRHADAAAGGASSGEADGPPPTTPLAGPAAPALRHDRDIQTRDCPVQGALGSTIHRGGGVAASGRADAEAGAAVPVASFVGRSEAFSARERRGPTRLAGLFFGACCAEAGAEGEGDACETVSVFPSILELAQVEQVDEWEKRRRATGCVAKLVKYEPGDQPSFDFRLAGRMKERLQVVALKPGGRADMAGVKAGDILASVDGHPLPQHWSGAAAMRALTGPCALVFLGFVGRWNAEVRMPTTRQLIGMPAQAQVLLSPPSVPHGFQWPPPVAARRLPLTGEEEGGNCGVDRLHSSASVQGASAWLAEQVELRPGGGAGAFFVAGGPSMCGRLARAGSQGSLPRRGPDAAAGLGGEADAAAGLGVVAAADLDVEGADDAGGNSACDPVEPSISDGPGTSLALGGGGVAGYGGDGAIFELRVPEARQLVVNALQTGSPAPRAAAAAAARDPQRDREPAAPDDADSETLVDFHGLVV